MASIIENLIKITGISDCLPKSPFIFKQTCIDENVVLEDEKPNISQIAEVIIESVVTNTKIINTPIGKSLEGYTLTGKSLIVEGEIRQKIQCTADDYMQTVFGTYFNIPFSEFIILPENFKNEDKFKVDIYIKNVYLYVMDERTIYENVCILFDVVYELP